MDVGGLSGGLLHTALLRTRCCFSFFELETFWEVTCGPVDSAQQYPRECACEHSYCPSGLFCSRAEACSNHPLILALALAPSVGAVQHYNPHILALFFFNVLLTIPPFIFNFRSLCENQPAAEWKEAKEEEDDSEEEHFESLLQWILQLWDSSWANAGRDRSTILLCTWGVYGGATCFSVYNSFSIFWWMQIFHKS